MIIHKGQHRGELSQQTQTAEVGLQTDLIRVLEDLLQTASVAYNGHICIQGTHQILRYMTWDQEPKAVAINALDFYRDPVTWLFLPVPLIPLLVLGSVVHEGLDRAAVKLLDLEKVLLTKITFIIGCCYHSRKNGH